MKTIFQAIKDEVAFPIADGLIENKCIARGLNGDDYFDYETAISNSFKGCVADCLYTLIETPNISEGDASFSLADRNLILKKVNSIYDAIGETPVGIEKPMVYINC